MVASNDVLYHGPERRPLQDVLTCIREGCTIAEAGFRLEANAERHLKSADEMARLFADYPDGVARTVEIADRVSLRPRPAQIRIPPRAGAARQDRHRPPRRPGLGRRGLALSATGFNPKGRSAPSRRSSP